MQLAASAAQRTRNDAKKLLSYSKQWAPGDTLRVLYPLFWDENMRPQIAVGAVWGFPVNDMKALGLKTIFIPSTNTFDGNGQPIEQPDLTYQFSKMAPLFIAGEKQSKLDKIAQKKYADENMRLEAYNKVQMEFSKDAEKPKKPVIGRAVFQIMTECLSVKKVGEKFDPETIAVSSRTLPDELIAKLYAIMNDPKYAPGPEDKFLEIEWKYPVNTSKGASGRAAVAAGLTSEYRLRVTDPELWKAITARMNTVSTDSDSIVKRATYEVEMSRVRQGIQSYISDQSEWLECLNSEDEDKLMKSIDLIRDLDVKRTLSKQELIDRIDKALAEAKAWTPEPVEPPITGDAPTIDDIIAQNAPQASAAVEEPANATVNVNLEQAAAVGVSADIQNLMANPNNITNDLSTSVDLNLDV